MKILGISCIYERFSFVYTWINVIYLNDISWPLEFVAIVQHHSCGYVDKLSDRKVVNICSVTRDVLQLSR